MTDSLSYASVELELARLQRRFDRERSARLEAERIAEHGLRQLYEKQQQLQLLETVAVAANQARSVNQILQLVIDQICAFAGWPVGHAYLRDSRRPNRLHPTMIWHCRQPEAVRELCQLTAVTSLESGVGLPGRVLASGEAAWMLNVDEDSTFVRAAAARQCGLKAACAFPVLAGEQVVAVLEFFNSTDILPDAALLHLMSQIGLQLGRVIERQQAEERLMHDAFHDSLTGLPNRTLFLDRLQRALTRRQRHPEYNFAMLFVDLDRFKVINDSLGHLAGDQLIKQIAERLRLTLRQEDTVSHDSARHRDTLARLGSDEFTLLLEDLRNPGDAIRVAERVQHALSTAFDVNGQSVCAAASIGIAMSGEHTRAEDILRNANLAMYRAKTLGGNRCEFFDQSMHASALNRLMVENDLRRALQQRLFVLHYQPVVSLTTGAIVGVEALVRWQKTAGQLVYPNDFIYIAEDSGLIAPLDMWVLEEACRTMRQWHQEFGDQTLTVSVNLSARLFAQADLLQQVKGILAATGICPAALRLEITESMTMSDTERAIDVMQQLKTMGVHLSIDDFGTGYSSLSYLHRLPADTLKIDRSFVSRMDQSRECFQIINSIMSLARNLGMKVIAEGPETAAHVQQLRNFDCDFGQGYFFCKPVAAAQIHRLLADAQPYTLPPV